MLKIGILGEFYETARLLEKIFINSKQSVTIFKLNKNLLKSTNFYKNSPDILIFNSFPSNITNKLNISQKCIPILSIDNLKENQEKFFNSKNLITYGFKKNAIITISSINHKHSLQFCIQKPIKNIKGKLVHQQEFPVNYANSSLNSVLSATLVGVLIELNIDSFRQVFLNNSSKIKSC